MGLHIVVCVKSVVVEAPAKATVRAPDNLELNPYDRPALEMGLQIREKRGGTVTALSMGPDCSAIALYEAMAMGADRMVLICDPALSGSDTLATSTALGAALEKLAPFDLVLFGTRTSDSDTGQVGPQTCVLRDLPLVTGVHAIQWQETDLVVERRADGFLEAFSLTLPAALTIHSSAVQPRDIGLLGIGSAYEAGKVETWNLFDIGLSPDQVGWAGSATRVPSWKRIKRERKCEFLSGTAEEQVNELMRRLIASGLVG
jgi:electron transfer flavoprotein beta subunit